MKVNGRICICKTLTAWPFSDAQPDCLATVRLTETVRVCCDYRAAVQLCW